MSEQDEESAKTIAYLKGEHGKDNWFWLGTAVPLKHITRRDDVAVVMYFNRRYMINRDQNIWQEVKQTGWEDITLEELVGEGWRVDGPGSM